MGVRWSFYFTKQLLPFAVMALSLLSEDRLTVIKDLAESVRHLEGDAAELGVYKGGSARVIATSLPQKKIYLFDTFKGMPFQDDGDIHQAGEFADTSFDSVLANLAGLSNVTLLAGIFPDETAHNVALRSFCFVHIDADQYRSTADAIRFFYPRLVVGGYLVFDDYGWRNCPGVKAAVDEFFSVRNERVMSRATHQVYICKCP